MITLILKNSSEACEIKEVLNIEEVIKYITFEDSSAQVIYRGMGKTIIQLDYPKKMQSKLYLNGLI